MPRRRNQFLTTLFLILVIAGCTTDEMAEQAAVDSTSASELEKAVDDSDSLKVPEPATAAPMALHTPKQATPAVATRAEPEQTDLVSTPITTVELASIEDAGQIYAAAIRHMYTLDNSFGEPGEPPEFPLVYIVSTTDDGTLLQAPATSPQELAPELQKIIEAELADMLFAIIWIERFGAAPVDSNNGLIAEGKGIVLTMGNILPQENGTVHLPFYMVCGSLCLSGKTYVLERIDGAWQITGSVGLEVQG